MLWKIALFFLPFTFLLGTVSLGVDRFFEEGWVEKYRGKRIGLIVNHTSQNKDQISTLSLFQNHPDLNVVALFCPEHGLKGVHYAAEEVEHGSQKGIPIYSLHGKTRRPTSAMLEQIDLLIYDIQCTGVRAYTYPSTLFYAMEEAAKKNIEVIVLDRPNPINGLLVDGPMLEERWRSYIGYVNVPYCHGMTIGELARFFNEEYQVQCRLTIVPMKHWKRSMSYRDTGLAWMPPSPNIPEADTPIYSSSTGILGELHLVNIGIGYSLPFKIVGAPWIDGTLFAEKLNMQKLPGVVFQPFFFRPFWGLYRGVDCEGVLIQITDLAVYRPLAVQYLILGMLKSLYPQEVAKRLEENKSGIDLFCKANGTEAIYEILSSEKYPAWKLIAFHQAERRAFLEKRKKYLLPYPVE